MKILVADDHELIREGLRAELAERFKHALFLVAENADGVRDAVSRHLDVDLVLLDLNMPGGDGFALLTEVGHRCPDSYIMVISSSEKTTDMVKSLDCGAAGYLTKAMPKSLMLTAIELVLAGGIYLPKELAQPSVQMPGPGDRASDVASATAVALRVGRLTGRQRDVLRFICLGKSNRDIADELDISLHTVKNHVAGVLKALEVQNRTAAAIAAEQLGICTKNQSQAAK